HFDGYVKPVAGGFFLSQRVPRALPVYFLAHRDGAVLPPASHLFEASFHDLLNKRNPFDRDHYDDFSTFLEADPYVLAASQWDAPQRLLGLAFRHFLGCSYGHASNCLIDASLRLWEIDFEKVFYL